MRTMPEELQSRKLPEHWGRSTGQGVTVAGGKETAKESEEPCYMTTNPHEAEGHATVTREPLFFLDFYDAPEHVQPTTLPTKRGIRRLQTVIAGT